MLNHLSTKYNIAKTLDNNPLKEDKGTSPLVEENKSTKLNNSINQKIHEFTAALKNEMFSSFELDLVPFERLSPEDLGYLLNKLDKTIISSGKINSFDFTLKLPNNISQLHFKALLAGKKFITELILHNSPELLTKEVIICLGELNLKKLDLTNCIRSEQPQNANLLNDIACSFGSNLKEIRFDVRYIGALTSDGSRLPQNFLTFAKNKFDAYSKNDLMIKNIKRLASPNSMPLNSMFKFFVAKVSRKCTIIARIHT